ncbi:MAG TPA: hypothetical protein VKB88_36120 [Bryobacteraceae bacterium]|nr:hypothetical protein [Bryobacteraceae bacterium]
MRKSLTFGAALFACAALANASLIATLSSETPVGSNFAFNYSATVTADERLDPAATDGATCPGPGNTEVPCDPPGTFFTIYDIPGFVSASVSTPGWTETSQLIGITPSTINGTSFDSPTIMNVTFMYAGPVVTGPASFSGFTITSSDAGINLDGHFTSQSTNNVGSDAGTTAQLSSSVAVPQATTTTPEPDSWLLLAAGFTLAAAGMWRRART